MGHHAPSTAKSPEGRAFHSRGRVAWHEGAPAAFRESEGRVLRVTAALTCGANNRAMAGWPKAASAHRRPRPCPRACAAFAGRRAALRARCTVSSSYRSPADQRALEPCSCAPRSARGPLLVRAFASRHPSPPVARRLFAGSTLVRLPSHGSSTRSFQTIDGLSYFILPWRRRMTSLDEQSALGVDRERPMLGH
jgi:hypothetical protein